jgi:hypothetical protein
MAQARTGDQTVMGSPQVWARPNMIASQLSTNIEPESRTKRDDCVAWISDQASLFCPQGQAAFASDRDRWGSTRCADVMAKAEATDYADVADRMSIPAELARRRARSAKLAEARTTIEARAKS